MDELKQPTISTPTTSMTEEQIRNLIVETMLNYSGLMRIKSGNLQSGNFISGSTGWGLNASGVAEFLQGIFRGALSAATIDIGGADATSWHVDINGNMWWGNYTTYASALIKISNTGLINLGTKVSIDGPNERYIVNDGTNDRVLIGKATGLF